MEELEIRGVVDRGDEGVDFTTKREEILQLFKKGMEFSEELLRINEQLRFKVARLEEENRALQKQAGSMSLVRQLVDRVEALEVEKASLIQRFEVVEAEGRDFQSRYEEIEQENNKLVNLYVAAYQIHTSLEFRDMLQVLLEITLNMMGAAKFVIFLLDKEEGQLYPVVSHGRDMVGMRPQPLGRGVIGTAALSSGPVLPNNGQDVLACVPLRAGAQPIGVMVLYELLVQKSSFAPVDHELMKLLVTHGGSAILASLHVSLASNENPLRLSSYRQLLGLDLE